MIVLDSGHQYLTRRGFVHNHGAYYYPDTAYPHLHVGLQSIAAYTEVGEVTWTDARTGLPRTRMGEGTYAYQTLAFVSYHLAGQPRPRHIWSANGGWAENIATVVTELNGAGLFVMCQMVLNVFAIMRETLPAGFRFG